MKLNAVRRKPIFDCSFDVESILLDMPKLMCADCHHDKITTRDSEEPIEHIEAKYDGPSRLGHTGKGTSQSVLITVLKVTLFLVVSEPGFTRNSLDNGTSTWLPSAVSNGVLPEPLKISPWKLRTVCKVFGMLARRNETRSNFASETMQALDERP